MIRSMLDAYEYENKGCGLGALTGAVPWMEYLILKPQHSALPGVWERQLGYLVSFYGGNTC
jgi:hypothetical protein